VNYKEKASNDCAKLLQPCSVRSIFRIVRNGKKPENMLRKVIALRSKGGEMSFSCLN
jgi:hypothetical protein